MQLARVDETDLLIPLYTGVHDQQQWVTFLTRLGRRTGADYTSLIFAQGDLPIHQANEVFAGRDLRTEAQRLGLERLYEMDRLPYTKLRPGRVYHPAEFTEGDTVFAEFHQAFNRRLGLSDERLVRIKEQEGTSAWLMLARNEGRFSAADGALLSEVVAHVAVALRSFVLVERQRIRASASRDALARTGVGWIALARDTRIIDIDDRLVPLLKTASRTDRLIGEKLHADTTRARQALAEAARDFAASPDLPPRSITLLDEPDLDVLLVPMTERPAAALALPVMLAFCRIPRAAEADRATYLSGIFGLSRKEAELAIALSDGRSILEAGIALGLSPGSSRNYSKRIYGKMGVHGQAELIRKILLSSANLA